MLARAINGMIKWIGVYTLLIFGLLALALGSVAYGLARLVRDLEIGFLLPVVLIALALSWLLARSRIKGWWGAFLLAAAGGGLILVWVGELWGSIAGWLASAGELLWQVLRRVEDQPLDTAAFLAALEELQVRAGSLLADLGLWLRSLGSGNPAFNYVAVALLWGLAAWLVGAWAGWFQCRREQTFVAILPAGVLLAGGLGYTYGPTLALPPLLFATFLLAALTHYIAHERSWKTRKMDYPEDARTEGFLLVIGLTLALVLSAALIPRLSVKRIIQLVQEWTRPQVEQVEPVLESFGLNQYSASLGTLGVALAGGLPNQHLIGSGPELSEQVVMSVQVRGGKTFEELQAIGIPLYWRAITYDQYTGRGWESSDVVLHTYEADDYAIPTEQSGYRLLQQDFRFPDESDLIYAAGEVVTLDENYRIAWRVIPGITETLKTPGDYFAGAVRQRAYSVRSLTPVVSEAELRASPGIYPPWISERYLALPNALPQRVIELARELARAASTPYDKVRAIEHYLRGYKYELNLPRPPQNRDLVDNFLFELQKGYCDYYASALVVMARAAGIPARLAVGYTHGNYDPVNRRFVVTENNAHSWPEVYFSDYGWIPFEPTAAQTEIQRPGSPADFPPELEDIFEPPEAELLAGDLIPRWLERLGLVLPGIAALVWVWFSVDEWVLKRIAPAQAVAQLYRRLYRHGRKLGAPAQNGATPYEFAANLERQIDAISGTSHWQKSFALARQYLRTLTNSYAQCQYSPHPLARAERDKIVTQWAHLRRKLLLARFVRWLRRQPAPKPRGVKPQKRTNRLIETR